MSEQKDERWPCWKCGDLTESRRAKDGMPECASHAPSVDEAARQIIRDFMNTISEGEGDYSCNECELNTYLCPHLFERLQGMIATALKNLDTSKEYARGRREAWDTAIDIVSQSLNADDAVAKLEEQRSA